jgi:hypothetical protein
MTSRDVGLARLLAAMLSTTPDVSVRNGDEAVRLTEEVMARGGEAARSDPGLFDQLAMGHAAVGRFDDAVAAQRRAIDLTKQSSDPGAAREMENRLALYLTHRPFVETRW